MLLRQPECRTSSRFVGASVELEYSAAEFRGAITGAWVDSSRDVLLTLNPDPAMKIDYSVSGARSKCITGTSMQVVGEMKTSKTGPVAVSGSFYAEVRLDKATLHSSFGTQGCTFIYAETNEAGEAELNSNGFCNLSVMGLGFAETLSLIKRSDVKNPFQY